MKTIQQLREQRDDLAKQARNILDQNESKWTDDLTAQVDEIYEKIARVDNQIKALQKQLDLEARLESEADDPDSPANGNLPGLGGNSQKDDVHSIVFDAFLRGGEKAVDRLDGEILQEYRDKVVKAAQSTGTNSEGGHLVPNDWGGRLLERMKEFGGVREVAEVITTEGGNQIDWPTVDETSEEGELIAENTTATDGDMAFGTVAINAYKYSSKVVTVPFELLQDQRIGDLEGFINRSLAMRIGRITNKHFTIGTGTSQPKGIVVASSLGKTGATGQTTSIIYDDLVDLEHAVDPAYRRNNPGWMMHDGSLKIIKKLKDGDGRPLWRPGVTGGDPADILGYSYTINQDMAEMAASAKSLLFGDFTKYLVRDVMNVTLFRFDDSAFIKKGQIGFLAWARSDGNLIDASTDAIKHYANAAS